MAAMTTKKMKKKRSRRRRGLRRFKKVMSDGREEGLGVSSCALCSSKILIIRTSDFQGHGGPLSVPRFEL